jgi:hypothetical protein
VGVAAADFAVLGVAGALARVLPPAARPVNVIGARFNQTVKVGIEVLAEHSLEVGAGYHVKEVSDHTIGNECLTMIVEVKAPRVGRAIGDGLENLPGGMIAPDAAVDGDSRPGSNPAFFG